MMAKFVPGPIPMGNIVKDYHIGNTRVIFCDDAYRHRSDEEQRQSIENYARIASEALRNQALAARLGKGREGPGP